MRYPETIVVTAVSASALSEGYGVVLSGNEGAMTATLTAAADVTNGIVCQTVSSGEQVAVAVFGPVDIYMADTTAAHAAAKIHTDGTGLAADANNAQALLITGGAAGLQKAMFFGHLRRLAPST